MQTIESFMHGDGAHWGLSDWYPENEAALRAALNAREPFTTGWYSSKKKIASACITSDDGVHIRIEVSVTDDFDTPGDAERTIETWTLAAVANAISDAWDDASEDRDANQEYEGFSVMRHGADSCAWVETYLVNIGSADWGPPPGDHYHYWGWQHDEGLGDTGKPHPDIPLETVQAFERFAHDWAFRITESKTLRIGAWEIKPWREPRTQEDPSDYAGMGWIGRDGRP
jgi:hypothetical protein